MLSQKPKKFLSRVLAKKPNTRVQGQDKFFSGGPAGTQNTSVGFYVA
jgi:hypothetical protein